MPVTVALTFVLGFLAGDMLNSQSGPTPTQKKFQTIINLIRKDYVDEVNLDSLLEHTLPSMLTNLDPHSAYIPAKDLRSVNEELDGSFCGIGVQFMLNNDTITVIEVISGGPAEKVGMMAGDRIVKVDDEIVAGIGITQEQVLKKLRGERDTKVKLGIKRPTSKKTLKFDVTRGDIPVTSIDAAYIVNPGIGYIKVNKFGRTTYDEFWQSLNDLKRDGAQDFIIDLRGNTGGFMEIAFMMANEFLEKGETIVSTKGRDFYSTKEVIADGTGNFRDSQVVVLLDEFSASSSEILAGALQDNDRGLVVGRRTFGKGLVQRPFPFPDGSMIRLTTARYYTPAGRCIQKPYEKGKGEDYHLDMLNRYKSGELWSADSIHFDEKLKCTTLGAGRTVYGGGGIMPDVFVPVDTTFFTPYYRDLIAKGIVNTFIVDYVEKNRNGLLNKYPDEDKFFAAFSPGEELEKALIESADKEGLPYNDEQWQRSALMIRAMLKGLMARDLYENGSYVRATNPYNPVYIEALKLISDPVRYNKLLQGK